MGIPITAPRTQLNFFEINSIAINRHIRQVASRQQARKLDIRKRRIPDEFILKNYAATSPLYIDPTNLLGKYRLSLDTAPGAKSRRQWPRNAR